MEFSRLEWVALPFCRASSQPKDRTQVSCIAGGSLSAEPPGKPKNTGVDSLFLLQRIFPTQESTRGLLHCRRILYQLSYQGSPYQESVPIIICLYFGFKTVIKCNILSGASLIAQLVKNPPAMQETPVRFLGWEDPLEKGEATHSSILRPLLWLSW